MCAYNLLALIPVPTSSKRDREREAAERCDEKLGTVICCAHLHTNTYRAPKESRRWQNVGTHTTVSKRSRFCDICLTVCWGRELSLARVWYSIHTRIWNVNLNIHALVSTHTDKYSCISFHVLYTLFTSYISADAQSQNYIRTPQYVSICFSIPMKRDEKSSITLHTRT